MMPFMSSSNRPLPCSSALERGLFARPDREGVNNNKNHLSIVPEYDPRTPSPSPPSRTKSMNPPMLTTRIRSRSPPEATAAARHKSKSKSALAPILAPRATSEPPPPRSQGSPGPNLLKESRYETMKRGSATSQMMVAGDFGPTVVVMLLAVVCFGVVFYQLTLI